MRRILFLLIILLVAPQVLTAERVHQVKVSSHVQWSGITGMEASTDIPANEFAEIDSLVRRELSSDTRFQVVELGSKSPHWDVSVVLSKSPGPSSNWIIASVAIVWTGKNPYLGTLLNQTLAAGEGSGAVAKSIARNAVLFITRPQK